MTIQELYTRWSDLILYHKARMFVWDSSLNSTVRKANIVEEIPNVEYFETYDSDHSKFITMYINNTFYKIMSDGTCERETSTERIDRIKEVM